MSWYDNDDDEDEVCGYCGGSGTVECDCTGGCQAESDCPVCGGSGYHTCPSCGW